MEDKPVCPWCGAKVDEVLSTLITFDCGSHKSFWDKDNPTLHRTTDCYERQLVALQAQVAEVHGYLKGLFASVAPQCEPEEKTIFLCTQIDNYIAGINEKNKVLQAQVAGMKALLQKYIPGCDGCEITFVQEAQALLSPTPAGEMVCVRREDLKATKDRLLQLDYSEHCHRWLDRIKVILGEATEGERKAAIGTGGKE